MVECAGLEIQCTVMLYREFESHPFRQNMKKALDFKGFFLCDAPFIEQDCARCRLRLAAGALRRAILHWLASLAGRMAKAAAQPLAAGSVRFAGQAIRNKPRF